MELPTKKTEKVYDFTKMNSIIYGPPKIGKTSFAATINNGDGVLFLATEDGHKHVEVFKVDILKWEDMYELARKLFGNKEYKTLVIDTVDILFRLCRKWICDKHGIQHQTDLAWGKGSDLLKDEFFRVLNTFNKMGFGLCFISHTQDRQEKTKTAEWTITDTSMPSAISKLVSGMCDFIFYVYSGEDGKRVVRTKPTKYINAGDRTGRLPEKMELDFGKIQEILKK